MHVVRFIGGPWDGKQLRLAGSTKGPELPDELTVRILANGEGRVLLDSWMPGDLTYIRKGNKRGVHLFHLSTLRLS